MNATVQSATPLQFTAPLWALRVNGLWLASLIISLSTASFSMLVKQWLREYLAFEYTAPQERLRAHQYRKPAIEKWKVFEIAAVLPMLLQLSLGLFFVGLCFFTANIDVRMGLTTIPLVCGWDFFFIASVFAPLVSPRCPYKIPLLKSVMRAVRIHVIVKMRHSLAYLSAGMASLIKCSAASDQQTPSTDMDDQEEDQVVGSDQDDKDILLSVGTTVTDDDMLQTIWDAFNQCSYKPEQSLAFVVELIVGRLGARSQELLPDRLRCIPDLSALSLLAWDTFMEMLADLVDSLQPGPHQQNSRVHRRH